MFKLNPVQSTECATCSSVDRKRGLG